MAKPGVVRVVDRKGHGKTRVFVDSLATLIDLSGTLADIPTEDETEAAAADWQQVANDLRTATKQSTETVEDADARALLEELVEA